MVKFHRESNSYRNVQSVQIPDFSNPAGFWKPYSLIADRLESGNELSKNRESYQSGQYYKILEFQFILGLNI
jgi:hypothetical protein